MINKVSKEKKNNNFKYLRLHEPISLNVSFYLNTLFDLLTVYYLYHLGNVIFFEPTQPDLRQSGEDQLSKMLKRQIVFLEHIVFNVVMGATSSLNVQRNLIFVFYTLRKCHDQILNL